jgi:acylpyruvate hydrolase
VEGDTLVDLGFADVGALLGTDGWGEHAALAGRVSPRSGRGRLRPCGPPSRQDHLRRANYRQHIHEMGWVLPADRSAGAVARGGARGR